MELTDLKTLFNTEFPSGAVTDTEKLIWFNNACQDIVRRTLCLRTSYTLDIAAATQEYDLSSSVLMIDADGGVCYYDSNSVWQRLEAASMNWLDNNVTNWRSKTSDTLTGYYKKGQTLGVYPKPITAKTDGLRVYYIAKPNVLSANTDVPFDDDESLTPYHTLIIAYSLWKAKQKRGKFTQAEVYKTEYYNGIVMMNREIHFEPDYQQVIRPYFKGAASHALKEDPLQTL